MTDRPRPGDPISVIVYGKGGVGKSTISTHLAVAFRDQGKRVLVVGCDPKTDTSTRLAAERPFTVIDMVARRSGMRLQDVLTPTGAGVDLIETGGPEPGTGCAGRGVSITCELLENDEAVRGRYDVVVFDVLGDLVCGGFVAPLRFGLGNNVYIVSSEETASLFAANNIARVVAQPYYDNVAVGGIIYNLRTADPPLAFLDLFAERLGLQVMGTIPRDELILEAEAEGQTVLQYAPDAPVAQTFREMAEGIVRANEAPLQRRATPLDLDDFWELIYENNAYRRARRKPD